MVSGADDLATPPERQRTIADAIPGARLEVLEGAAHLASVERADTVSALLVEHMA